MTPQNEAGRDPAAPVYMKDIKQEYREHIAQALNMASATLTQTVMSLGFEIVKHLAVINAAGVAGAAALYSIAAAQKGAIAALPWFLAGLVVTILAMIVIYAGGLIFTWSFQGKVMMILTDQAPVLSVKAPVWARIAVAVNWLAVLGTLGVFLVGVYKLVCTA
ncbi:ER membrane protein complex subunit 6 [Ralstonia mannitolilytica]|uniref:hypothetical protein n=1 Tax=Ralstonia mannitolilytica TaxID=105219 RepID=UPI0039B58A4C